MVSGCRIALVGFVTVSLLSGARTGLAQEKSPALLDVDTAEALVEAAAKPGARTIRLAPGEYTLEAPLSFRNESHVNLFGSGWNTTIRRAGKGPALVFEDAHFCLVADLMVVAGNEAEIGILYSGKSSSNTVRHCRISSFSRNGIRYDGLKDTPMSSNSILDCHFIDNGEEQLHSFYNNDFFIIGNQFGRWKNVPRVGAALVHSSAGSYSLNYHWDNEIALVLGPGSDYNRVENNRFEESRTHGILIGNPDRADQWNRFNTFTGNTIHTNSKENSGRFDAVVAYDAHDTIFSSNQVFSWYPPTTRHRSALVLARGSADWIVTGNILRHHTAPAIVAPDGAGHLIKDNIADPDPEPGP